MHIKLHKGFHLSTTEWNMLFFGEKNTFIFFKYISIYKDVLALFHYKNKWFHMCPRGISLTSLWSRFHEVLIFFKKIALNIHLLLYVKAWTLYVHYIYIYVHSQQGQQKTVYICTMALNWHALRRARVTGSDLGSEPVQWFCQLWASSMQTPSVGGILRALPARVAGLQLRLVSCLGSAVRVAVEVSQQRFAIGQSICWQQLLNLLHCLLISHFLLFQGPDQRLHFGLSG